MKRCTRRVPQLRWWLMGFFWLLLPGLSWAGLSNLRTGGKLVPTQTTVADGDKLSVTVPVWNNGPDTTRTSQTGSPRSSYLYVYLSRNPGDLNGARSLKSVVIASLNAGARVNVKVDIQIPTGWVAGTSYLHAVVDGYGNYVKNESNENDNYSYVYGHSVALSVVHKRSNLRTSAPLKPSKTSVLDGEKITVSVPVWNNGNAETLNGIVGSSRTFYVYVYISSNPGTEAGGTRVGSLLVPTLAAGAKRDAQIQVTIPTNYRRGVAYLHAIVDSYGNYVKNESNENDNASYTYGHSISINVDRIRSNLRTNGAMTATKTSLKEGETITVNVPIINNGNDETRSSVTGGSRSYYVYLYLGIL